MSWVEDRELNENESRIPWPEYIPKAPRQYNNDPEVSPWIATFKHSSSIQHVEPNSTYTVANVEITRKFPSPPETCGSPETPLEYTAKKKNPGLFDLLPPHLLDKIFGYIDYCDLCHKWFGFREAHWMRWKKQPERYWICCDCAFDLENGLTEEDWDDNPDLDSFCYFEHKYFFWHNFPNTL